MKKKQHVPQAVPLSLFDQADLDGPTARVPDQPQAPKAEQTDLFGDDMQSFQPFVDPERLPVYQKVQPSDLLAHLNAPPTTYATR